MFDYSKLPQHMQDGMRLYVEEGIEGGSFLMAVLCNDFKGACGRADAINREYLWDYANFLYNELPAQCQGSEEKVMAWIERGGLNGSKAG